MKPGAEKDIDIPERDPLTWKVDGVPVGCWYKSRVMVMETEREVDAVVLVTVDGHNHYLWDEDDE